MRFTIVLVARAWLPRRLTVGSAVVQVMTAVRANRTKSCRHHKDQIRKCLSGSRTSFPLDKQGISTGLAEDQLEGACGCVSAPSLAQHDQHIDPVHVYRTRCSAGRTVYVKLPSALSLCCCLLQPELVQLA